MTLTHPKIMNSFVFLNNNNYEWATKVKAGRSVRRLLQVNDDGGLYEVEVEMKCG